MPELSLQDVQRAREILRPLLPPTPLRPSSAGGGTPLRLKLECWQPTGSFKVRGALCRLAGLGPRERAAGVVAASAGNHALGVAFAVEALGGGTSATVFVPKSAPRTKLDKLRRLAVAVCEVGETYDEAAAAAREHQSRTGAFYVEAFEDAEVAAGQGTVGLEILEQLRATEAVIVPVGGGGLLAGTATAVKALSPATRVIAVQAEASPAFSESLRRGRPLLTYAARPTLADGLAGGIGRIAFDHRRLVDDAVNVSEQEIADAMLALLGEDQVVAEASGAASVAAVRSGRVRPRRGGALVALVTGGNVDLAVLRSLLARA